MPIRTFAADQNFMLAKSDVKVATGILNGDWTSSLLVGDSPDITVHLTGIFGGATVTAYGSNNSADIDTEPTSGSTTWFILKDNADNDVTFTGTSGNLGEVIITGPAIVAFRASGGGVSTNLQVRVKRTYA